MSSAVAISCVSQLCPLMKPCLVVLHYHMVVCVSHDVTKDYMLKYLACYIAW